MIFQAIIEALIGFDGIAIAQSLEVKSFNITKEQLALAVAAEVPSADKKSLIANPYKKYSDIDASLPNREIIVYGPPKSSGTRDSFEELVLQSIFKKMPLYTDLYKKDEKAALHAFTTPLISLFFVFSSLISYVTWIVREIEFFSLTRKSHSLFVSFEF